MATDLERLVVSLDADITKLTRQLKRAGVEIDDFGKDATRKAKRAADDVSSNLGKINDNARLSSTQTQQLGFQLNDIATSLGSGSSPFQVLAQQGGQVYQALSMNGGIGQGLQGVKTGLLELATPTRLALAGFGTLAASAVYAGYQYAAAQDDIKKGLQGIGAASGATVNDINQIAERISAAKSISINAARDIATAIAATGKVGAGNIEGVAGLAPGFARLMGTDLQTAGAELAGIFAEPIAGADTFIKKLGGINDQTRELIKNLTEQGNRQQAIIVLQNAVQPVLDAAQDSRSPGRKLLDTIVQRGSQALDYTGRVAAATVNPEGTEEDQLRTAQRQLEMAKQVKAALPSLFGGEDSLANTALDALQQQVDQLTRKLEAAGAARKKLTDDINGAEATRNAGPIVRSLDPAGSQLEKAENDLKSLGQSIATLNLDPSNANSSELDKYVTKYGELKTRVDLLKEAYDKGGASARAALVAADYATNTAGLSSYERGLRAIVQQYGEMARAAREAGNEGQARGFEAAGMRAQDAYRAQNVERARGEISIPPEFYNVIRAAESSGNDRAVSETGAVGRYQFIKSTWLELFQQVKSSRYAEIQKANTGADGNVNAAAVNAAVLALRNDPALQEELVRALTQRNAAELDKRGIPITSRNLYGAHNIGTAGISALVKAQEEGRGGTNAQSLLDPIKPSLVSSNRAYYGNGKTVDEALATLDRKTLANSASARAAKEDVIATDAQTASMGKSATEAARLASINNDLRQARENGEEIGLRYKNAEELLAASANGTTGALKAQTDQFIENAKARERVVATQLNTRFQQDQTAAREALGRTYEEQAAYTGAKAYGTPGSEEFKNAKAGIEEIQGLTTAKNYTGSFLKDLNYDLMQAKSFGDAALGSLQRLLSKAGDAALDKLVSSLFAPGGGGASLFAGVTKFFTGGFAAGGYTGDGARNDPAGVVHKGEYVFDKATTSRLGVGTLEAIRRGMPAYAAGGFVGALPSISTARPASSGSSRPSVRMGDTIIDARGADSGVEQRLAALVAAQAAESRRTIGQQLSNWKEDN